MMFRSLLPILLLATQVATECSVQGKDWSYNLIDKLGQPHVVVGISYKAPQAGKNNVKFTVKVTFKGKTKVCGVFNTGELSQQGGWIEARCKNPKAMAADSVQIEIRDGGLSYCGKKIWIDPLRCEVQGEIVVLEKARCECPKGTEYNDGRTKCEERKEICGDSCPVRAQKGQCLKYVGCVDIWKDCRKDCEKLVTCKSDKHHLCECWASIGECKQNPKYMLPNCPCSCRKYSAVSNDSTLWTKKCVLWTKRGGCITNPKYMWPKCPKECNQWKAGTLKLEKRTPIGCVPDACPARVRKGHCKEYIGCVSMWSKCKLDCLPTMTCKSDKHHLCECWASIGECKQNPKYMLPNCPCSCRKYAHVKNDAANWQAKCVEWAKIGGCKENPGYMLKKCKKACDDHAGRK